MSNPIPKFKNGEKVRVKTNIKKGFDRHGDLIATQDILNVCGKEAIITNVEYKWGHFRYRIDILNDVHPEYMIFPSGVVYTKDCDMSFAMDEDWLEKLDKSSN
jgi:hypothetical protein